MDKALIEKMNSSSALRERPGRQTGTVKFFNTSKGYGFIAADGGADMFVHASGVITPPLATGDAVDYWVSTNERNGKTKAIAVSVIE